MQNVLNGLKCEKMKIQKRILERGRKIEKIFTRGENTLNCIKIDLLVSSHTLPVLSPSKWEIAAVP